MPEKKLIASGKQPGDAPTPPSVAPTPESESKDEPETKFAPKPNKEKVRNPFYQPASASIKEFSPGKSLTPGTTPEKEAVYVDVSPSVYNVEDGKEESDGENSNNSIPLVVNIDDEIILNQLNGSQQSTPNSNGQLISERFFVVFDCPKKQRKIFRWISAKESKKWLNQKVKGTLFLLYLC